MIKIQHKKIQSNCYDISMAYLIAKVLSNPNFVKHKEQLYYDDVFFLL